MKEKGSDKEPISIRYIKAGVNDFSAPATPICDGIAEYIWAEVLRKECKAIAGVEKCEQCRDREDCRLHEENFKNPFGNVE